MGLAVTAYKKIRIVENDLDDEDLLRILVNPAFPGRADDLVDGATYDYADSMRGWSAPYSSYGEWRNQLAALAGYPAVDHADGRRGVRKLHTAGAWAMNGGPFWELINFADNEGCIGAVVSAKLARDFAEHQSKADAHSDPWFRERYAQWRSVFEFAADGGAVEFH